MKKKITIFLLLYMLSSIFSNLSTAFAKTNEIPDPPEVSAEAAILINADTGEVLFEKNPHKKEYPASITKLMTVLLALENGDFSDILTFSETAVFGIERDSSHIALDVGEQLTLEQTLYAVMMASANEASIGIAEYLSGSIEAFASRMNERAVELGCQNTHFVNPNGLHDDNHYTTAYDMALIAKELLKFDEFRNIMATTYYEIPPTNKQEEPRYLYAQHKMIKENSNFYDPECEGGKTGFTNQALNTLVTYEERDGMELIVVVLRDVGTNIYTDTKALFEYGFENFKEADVFSAAAFRSAAKIEKPGASADGEKDAAVSEVALYATKDLSVTIPKTTDPASLTQKVVLKDLPATVAEGMDAGEVQIYLGDTLLASSPVVVGKINTLKNPAAASQKELDQKTIFGLASRISVIAIAFGSIILLLIYKQIRYEREVRARKRRFRERYRRRQS